jgi:hypothetical protein
MKTSETKNNHLEKRQSGTPNLSSPRNSSSGNSSASTEGSQQSKELFTPPAINLPKGGDAIQGIGEKFQANPVAGTGSYDSDPIAMSPGTEWVHAAAEPELR